ncbi:hypothetical protein KC909_00750 [Candidatus Dojkabacteria bacterium]|uniref:Uncharacterized protein n=1 Tax=Candidatus Dojkabacteria bacterium TaxID=2099670 RepID=A0A955L4Q3_9BACT|nr:hypothetical protein [Candidatus Dojkabacteria bacterium]
MSELVLDLQVQPQETPFGRAASRLAGLVAEEARNAYEYGLKAPLHWARYARMQAGHVREYVTTGTTTITPQEVMLNAQIGMITAPYLVAAGMALADNAPHLLGQMAHWMHIGGHHPQGPDNNHFAGMALQGPEQTPQPTRVPINELYPGYCSAEPGQVVQQSYASSLQGMADYYHLTPQQILDANPGLVVTDGIVDPCACVVIPSGHLDVSSATNFSQMPAMCTDPSAVAPTATSETVTSPIGIMTVTPEPTVVPSPTPPGPTPTPHLSVNEILQNRLDNPQCGLGQADYQNVVPNRFNLLGAHQQTFGSTNGQETTLFNEVFAEQFACNPTSSTPVYDGSGHPISMTHLDTIQECMAQVATYDSDVSAELNLRTEAAQGDWLKNVCAHITLHDVAGEAIMIADGDGERQKTIYDFIVEAAQPAADAVRQLRLDINQEAMAGGSNPNSLINRANEVENTSYLKVFGGLAVGLLPALTSFLARFVDDFTPIPVPDQIKNAYLVYPWTLDKLKRAGRWAVNLLPSNDDDQNGGSGGNQTVTRQHSGQRRGTTSTQNGRIYH